jgi:hypothetical protein
LRKLDIIAGSSRVKKPHQFLIMLTPRILSKLRHLNCNRLFDLRSGYLKLSITFALSLGSLNAQNNALSVSSGNYIAFTYNPALDFAATDKFSIEGWFRSNSSTATIYSNLVDMMPFTGHEVQLNGGRIGFSIANTDIVNHLMVMTTATFNDNNWHHFACIYKGSGTPAGMTIYVDGAVQTVSTTFNTLAGTTVSGNPVHMASRANMNYYYSGELDEFRVWKKALCSLEVVQRKNCHVAPTEPDLLAYYNFNQGTAGGNNSTVTSLADISGNNNTGTLTGFALSGSSSNWIASIAPITGTCNYQGAPISITGNTIICRGWSNLLTGTGAVSYTWSTAANSSTIMVNPMSTTTYTVSGTDVHGCLGTASIQQVVETCVGIKDADSRGKFCVVPNPSNGKFIIRNGGNSGSPVRIEIYNPIGLLVYKAVVDLADPEVDISSEMKGLYLVRLSDNEKVSYLRVLVE